MSDKRSKGAGGFMENEHLSFTIFLIYSLAENWNKSPVQVYRVLSTTGILDEYIIPCYDVLHTLGKEYLVEDITDFVKEKYEDGGGFMTNNINENLDELQMAKKRDHKIMITDEAINKVPRIQYKHIPEVEYDNLWDLAKNVLRISKEENSSNEVALTYTLAHKEMIERGEKYIGVSLGNEHDVDPLSTTTAYHLVSSAKDCVVIVLHNHPSLSKFSLSDILFLLKYEAIKMLVVVTNLGNVSYLVKNEKYNYQEAINLFNAAVEKHNVATNLKKLQEAADYFLKNCYTIGIEYEQ